MPGKVLVPVRKFLRLLDYMGRIGLDPDAMAEAFGMSQRNLERLPPDQLLAAADYSRMYRHAVRQMETLKLPIPWAAGIGSEAHALMCQSIISCKTLGDALDMAQRFDRLLYPLIGYRMRMVRGDSHFELHYQVRTESEGSVFAPEDWDRAEHYETVARASGLLVWYGFCGWLIGRSIDLEEVQISAPQVSDAYRTGLIDVFHCPLHFDAAENKFVAPAEYLERRLVHTPGSLQEFLDNAVFGLIST